MTTYKDLLRAEKKALNKLFVRELSNVRKESYKLDKLKEEIVRHINYANSEDRKNLEQKYVNNQIINLLNQYEKKIEHHLTRLRRVNQIEKDINYTKKNSYHQDSYTFKRLNYIPKSCKTDLEYADNTYYPVKLKQYINRLNTTYIDLQLNAVIPVRPKKNKLYLGTYTKNDFLSRRVLYAQKARLNKEVTTQISLIEESKKKLDGLTANISNSCENIGRAISKEKAYEYQKLCIDHSQNFVTYINQLVDLQYVRNKLHQTRIALVHNTSMNIKNKIKYINASQTLKKVNYTQDWLSEKLYLALRKYQAPQVLSFYESYTNASSRQRISDGVKGMNELFAKIQKEKKVVENTQALQSLQLSQVSPDHMVSERTQSNQSINSRRVNVLISKALAKSERDSYINRNQKADKNVSHSERRSML